MCYCGQISKQVKRKISSFIRTRWAFFVSSLPLSLFSFIQINVRTVSKLVLSEHVDADTLTGSVISSR